MRPFALLGRLSFPYCSVCISSRAEIQIICQIYVNCLFQGASPVAQWLRICLRCRRHRRPGFDPWVGKMPRRRAWQPTPVFLPGESPWTEEPDDLQSMGLQRDGHDWVTKHCTAQKILIVSILLKSLQPSWEGKTYNMKHVILFIHSQLSNAYY